MLVSMTQARAVGLRERKRRSTLASIQSEALRLFRAKGYAETTVVEIAAAAGVSERTFFRYFPTKEDVVLLDELDSGFVASLRGQPNELTPFAAMARALGDLLGHLTSGERTQQRERVVLILGVPELRARMLDQVFARSTLIAQLIAERLDLSPDDPQARILGGAFSGAAVAALQVFAADPTADLGELLTGPLSVLEARP
jgi:AcrR family transcriptional regulator